MNIFSVLDTSDGEEEVQLKKKDSATENEAKKQQSVKSSAKPQSQSKARESKVEQVEVKPAVNPDTETKEKKEDNRGGRPRGKEGFRRGEKHHGAINPENEKPRKPKREFERRSGTGRGREVSRGGRGPYGFGNVEQEALDAEKDPAKVEVETPVENSGNLEDVVEPEVESADIVPEVEEPVTISYDDFIKKREEARANSALLSALKARTVQADIQSVKAGEEETDAGKAAKASTVKKDQRSSNKTQLFDVQFKFENSNDQRFNGRRDREFNYKGGREFNNNKGGRFSGRTRKPKEPAPAPLNNVDFPSL